MRRTLIPAEEYTSSQKRDANQKLRRKNNHAEKHSAFIATLYVNVYVINTESSSVLNSVRNKLNSRRNITLQRKSNTCLLFRGATNCDEGVLDAQFRPRLIS